LPSWLTNEIRIVARAGSGEPRSASSARQAITMAQDPAMAAATDPAIVYQRIRPSAICTPDHSTASP
jgi:hypothetical protein